MRKFIILISTFSLVAVTLFYTSVTAFASNYVGMNDTVYKGADYWGLEDLPYGVDTGVIQFQYGPSNYITFYFDKLSVFDQYDNYDVDLPADRMYGFLKNHYWSCFWDDSSGEWDYLLNIKSDSPIYYKKSYAANGLFSSTLGTVETVYVTLNGLEDGSLISGGYSQSYKIYSLTDYRVSQLVGDWELPDSYGTRRVYSNCFQYKIDDRGYYLPCPAGGTTQTITDGRQVGYNIKYYPSCEYLLNASVRQQLSDMYDVLDGFWTDFSDQMFTVNGYLEEIKGLLEDAEFYLSNYYPRFLLAFQQMVALLQGPEYDSSQGIGSNTEFGDSVGGLMQDTEAPSIDVSGIESNLGNSFLFIRTMFDKVLNEFNLSYVVIFLLGMSFIAYTLGRAISNRMNR